MEQAGVEVKGKSVDSVCGSGEVMNHVPGCFVDGVAVVFSLGEQETNNSKALS